MTEFAVLNRANVVRSLTNPRKHFDPAYIKELGESAKLHGIIQPLLVRPLPFHRLPDTPRNVTHEIVCGECRDRGCEAGGVLTYPVMIRDLTDDQVLEIQIIENLKRRDLTELEEAEGYEQLMRLSKITADEVAIKIGKSRSYVFARLKLLDLGTEGRTALREGKIDASRALLVARIPDGKLQIKALKEIVDGRQAWGSNAREPLTYRQALDHIQDNYMLKLGSAKFKITAIDLVPAAGSCMACTKRTGHDPDLFSDVKGADVCTDPPCFHKKEDAHAANLVNEAKAKGQTIITGKEALELMPQQGYNSKFKGYKRLDDVNDSPTDKPLRKIIGKVMKAEGIEPVMIDHPHKKGELVAVLPNETVARLLKDVTGQAEAAKTVSAEAKQFADQKSAKAAEKLKNQFEQGWRDALLSKAWNALNDMDESAVTADVYRYLARLQINSLSTDEGNALAGILELDRVARHSALTDYLFDCKRPDKLLLLLIMLRDSNQHNSRYVGNASVANEGLMLVAGNVFDGPLHDVIKATKAEVKKRLEPAVKAKATPTTAAAEPSKGEGGKVNAKSTSTSKTAPRKPKLTAAEAISGIAAAMQSDEESASANAVAPTAQASAQAAVDPLLANAKALVVRQQKASVRLLKSELSVGTTKALALMDQLEKAGVVSACDQRGAREVLVAA